MLNKYTSDFRKLINLPTDFFRTIEDALTQVEVCEYITLTRIGHTNNIIIK